MTENVRQMNHTALKILIACISPGVTTGAEAQLGAPRGQWHSVMGARHKHFLTTLEFAIYD